MGVRFTSAAGVTDDATGDSRPCWRVSLSQTPCVGDQLLNFAIATDGNNHWDLPAKEKAVQSFSRHFAAAVKVYTTSSSVRQRLGKFHFWVRVVDRHVWNFGFV